MSDYAELKSLLKRWGVAAIEFSDGEEKVIEPVCPNGSGLTGTEFIFNPDESFHIIRIDIP